MTDLEEYVARLPYWNDLTNKQKETVKSCAMVQHYEKGSIIHGVGSSCLGMMYVLKGTIRVYMLSEEGREVTLFRMEKGDPCVMSASCAISQITFDIQMVTEEESDCLVLDTATFMSLTEENIYVKCFMYELMTEKFSTVMWTMQQILFSKIDRRLAGFLVSESERTGSAEIHMTHEEIAMQISSAREVVARMLKRFVAEGLVELKRGSIVIKDLGGLKEI